MTWRAALPAEAADFADAESGVIISFDSTVFGTAQTITLLDGVLSITNPSTVNLLSAGVTVAGVISNSSSLTVTGSSTLGPLVVNSINGTTGTLTISTGTDVTLTTGASTIGQIFGNTGTLTVGLRIENWLST